MAASSTQTRNGKLRFKGHSIPQLETLIEKSNKPRDKAKFQNRIKILQSR